MARAEALETVRQLTAAWMAKDRRAMERHLTDDIVEIGPAFPEPLAGKGPFFRRYRAYLEGPLVVASYRILSPRVVAVTADLAVVYFSYRMRTLEEGVEVESRGKESMIVRRSGGVWRVAFIHWHRDAQDSMTTDK